MQPLILLHGAIGAQDQLKPLADKLSDSYDVHTLSFSGHGGVAYDAEFSIAMFAAEVLAYMDEKGLQQASVFGYSMGGYVGMYLCKHHAQRVGRIVTLATKYHWDEATALKETKMLDAAKIEERIPAFAKALQQRHAPNDWKEVLLRTQQMLHAMGQNNPLQLADYSTIANPALILLGDKDKMVGLDETVAVYTALPNAQMGMLPATQHPIEQANIDALTWFIKYFIG
jgi:Predicted hydrolases or acyltransferases (alpha/beta hydrolase superfamily)